MNIDEGVDAILCFGSSQPNFLLDYLDTKVLPVSRVERKWKSGENNRKLERTFLGERVSF